jgi:SAM-dependent methyltransferase
LAKKEPGINSFHFQPPNGIAGIIQCIEAIDQGPLLYEEKNFNSRTEAIDFIEFQIIDQIEWLLQKTDQPNELILLKDRAVKIKHELEEINAELFQRLRESIRNKSFTGKTFKSLINEYVDFRTDLKEHYEEEGYDNLDIFINELTSFRPIPEQTRKLEAEMVFYQKTPARIIFELAEEYQFTEDDVFFDMGSGLGQAAILVNLLTGITAHGVEFEPAFCDYAKACTEQLNLPDVTFINADARKADYSKGTVFFMYTPFKGGILQEVLEVLRKESLSRKIKIFTYGPCTAQVALECWLDFSGDDANSIYSLGVFSSR